jgi:hypothetical protein
MSSSAPPVSPPRAREAWPRTTRLFASDDDLVPLLLFVVLGAFAFLTPAQNDTWWHLRHGREIWETGAGLRTDVFSHTAYGAVVHNYWWLSQLLFYALHSLGGPILLTVFAGGCAFAAVGGSWWLVRGSWEAQCGLLLFLMLATPPEWAVRPQVISLALLVLSAHLVARDRLAWMPLVCLLWANAHPQVVFGVLLSSAAALEALVWSRARFMRDALVAACSVAATFVSPGGWYFWPDALRTVSLSRALEIQEYMPPLDAGSLPFWVALVALVGLAATRRATLVTWSRGDRILAIAAVLLAVASFGASRNVPFFAVVAAPVLSRLWLGSHAAPPRSRRPAGAPAYVLVAVAVVVAGIVSGARWRDGGVSQGWRPMSASVIDAVRACPDPLFNTLEDGGYLMWVLPARRVFIDSRVHAYPSELLSRSRDADLYGNYVGLFNDHGIACAVVAAGSPLARALARDRSMTRTYADTRHAVFTRSPR